MRQSAAVLCHDKRSLQTLEATLEQLGIELVNCPSGQGALELVMTGRCSTLIVDFDLPGAEEVIRMAALLPPGQKPALLAVASRAWPGTGQAFQSGASRILYRPFEAEQLKEALKADRKARKSNRAQVRALRSENPGLSGPRKRNAYRNQYRYRRARPRRAGHRTRAHEFEPGLSLCAARH